VCLAATRGRDVGLVGRLPARPRQLGRPPPAPGLWSAGPWRLDQRIGEHSLDSINPHSVTRFRFEPCAVLDYCFLWIITRTCSLCYKIRYLNIMYPVCSRDWKLIHCFFSHKDVHYRLGTTCNISLNIQFILA
jgi:hypothetical protein